MIEPKQLIISALQLIWELFVFVHYVWFDLKRWNYVKNAIITWTQTVVRVARVQWNSMRTRFSLFLFSVVGSKFI